MPKRDAAPSECRRNRKFYFLVTASCAAGVKRPVGDVGVWNSEGQASRLVAPHGRDALVASVEAIKKGTEFVMFIRGLDHFNIWANDVDATRHFYCNILGLTEGPRPKLSYPGIWLYCGDHPIVHVNIGKTIPGTETGAFDHVAFGGTGDPQLLINRLGDEGIKHESRVVSNGVRQIFCSDPNGVKVEFNLPPA